MNIYAVKIREISVSLSPFSSLPHSLTVLSQGQLLTSPDSLRDFKLVKDDILPELRQLMRVDANHENQERMIELMERLRDLCSMPGQIYEPNKQNQLMLDNFGERKRECMCVAELNVFFLRSCF